MNSKASNAMPFKKRQNPLEGNTVQPVHQEPEAVVQVQKPQPRTYSQPQRQVVAQEENNRLKYTATMDKDLHIRLKVAAAMSGIQISSFIEEAILEKLEKEGL